MTKRKLTEQEKFSIIFGLRVAAELSEEASKEVGK